MSEPCPSPAARDRCSSLFPHNGNDSFGEALITLGCWHRHLGMLSTQMQRYSPGSATAKNGRAIISSVEHCDGLTARGDSLAIPVFRAARSF